LGPQKTISPRLAIQRSSVGIVAGVIGGLATAGTLGSVFSSLVVALGVFLGVAFALFGPPELTRVTAPRRLLRDDAIIFGALAAIGTLIGALGWVAVWLSGKAVFAPLAATLIGVIVGVFSGGHPLRSPDEVTRPPITAGRRSITGAAVGALFAGTAGHVLGVQLGHGPMIDSSLQALGGSAAFGLFLGLVGGFAETTSGWYRLAAFWYFATGRLPLRVMTFLDDAHRRGVFRQVGAAYVFRHARLQAWLSQANRVPQRNQR
jgi:hypothetical protein